MLFHTQCVGDLCLSSDCASLQEVDDVEERYAGYEGAPCGRQPCQQRAQKPHRTTTQAEMNVLRENMSGASCTNVT